MNQRASISALVFGISSALFGCGGMPTEDEHEAVATAGEELYVNSTYAWFTRQIRVCWQTPGWEADKARVQRAIERTWVAETQIGLLWTADCSGGGEGVRIVINDDWPAAQIGAVPVVINMNFSFATLPSDFPLCLLSEANRIGCIEAIAVHEFGHAMSFIHEQNRTDTPSSCTKPNDGTTGDWATTTWDADSVMNYCNVIWNNAGRLSRVDIEGAQEWYGDPFSVAVTSNTSSRIDVFVRGGDNGVWTQTWNGSGWSDWGAHSDFETTGAPSAVTRSTGRVDVIATKKLGGVAHRAFGSGGSGVWGAWSNLGAPSGRVIIGSPTLVALGASRMVAFARVSGSTGPRIAYRMWNSSGGWGSWALLCDTGCPANLRPVGRLAAAGRSSSIVELVWTNEEGSLYGSTGTVSSGALSFSTPFQIGDPIWGFSSPAIAAGPANRVDVVALATSGSGYVFHRAKISPNATTSTGTLSTPRVIVENSVIGSPALVSLSDTQLRMYYRRTDRQLREYPFTKTSTGVSIGNVRSLPGAVDGNPGAVAPNSGEVDLYTRTVNGSVQETYWTPDVWNVGNLGGTIW
jgi:hypothetical protein